MASLGIPYEGMVPAPSELVILAARWVCSHVALKFSLCLRHVYRHMQSQVHFSDSLPVLKTAMVESLTWFFSKSRASAVNAGHLLATNLLFQQFDLSSLNSLVGSKNMFVLGSKG